MPAYSSLDEAVYYAADAARAVYGDKQEAMSLVYEQDGLFHFTPPTSRSRSSKNVSVTVKIPKGGLLRFIVHNHPHGEGHDVFPEHDIATAERFKVPSAIIFGATEPQIRVFRPGATQVSKVADRKTRAFLRKSLGEPFEWRPPAPEPK